MKRQNFMDEGEVDSAISEETKNGYWGIEERERRPNYSILILEFKI